MYVHVHMEQSTCTYTCSYRINVQTECGHVYVYVRAYCVYAYATLQVRSAPPATRTYVHAYVVVVEILFRIADQTGRFAQYYDGDIIREVNSKEMKCLVHVVYHQ